MNRIILFLAACFFGPLSLSGVIPADSPAQVPSCARISKCRVDWFIPPVFQVTLGFPFFSNSECGCAYAVECDEDVGGSVCCTDRTTGCFADLSITLAPAQPGSGTVTGASSCGEAANLVVAACGESDSTLYELYATNDCQGPVTDVIVLSLVCPPSECLGSPCTSGGGSGGD